MIIRHTQKDVGKKDIKWIGPFTKRQVLFGGAGIVIGMSVYTFLGSLPIKIDGTTMFMISATPAAILSLFGWQRDIKLEQYLAIIYFYRIMSPQKRYFTVETELDKDDLEERYKKKIEDIESQIKDPKKLKKEKQKLTKAKKKEYAKQKHIYRHVESKKYPSYL
ncbi:PrgI family protein [Lachnospiraceae bacterium KHCPX20]|nr:PrgI family protein [Lachnospiraceae bacterium KHCPX20]